MKAPLLKNLGQLALLCLVFGCADESSQTNQTVYQPDAMRPAVQTMDLGLPADGPISPVPDSSRVARDMDSPAVDSATPIAQDMAVLDPQDAALMPDQGLDMAPAPIPDAGLPNPICPDGPQFPVANCLFGETTFRLRDAETVEISVAQRYLNPADLDPLTAAQFVFGFECDGLFLPGTVDAAFELIDFNELRVIAITDRATGASYTWLRFYQGDTEIGYIYAAGTLEVVALIGDGDITHCQATR